MFRYFNDSSLGKKWKSCNKWRELDITEYSANEELYDAQRTQCSNKQLC